jgi:hypothetical protein
MKYLKEILLSVWLLLASVFLLDSCSAQTRYLVKQSKASEVVDSGMKFAFNKTGVVENPSGSNSGTDVEIFLRSVGLKKGNPWCVAFCQWAYLSAAKSNGVKLNLPKTGHSLSLLKEVSRYSECSYDMPGYGDWVIFKRGETGKGHCGLLVSFCKDSIVTIEGNTSSAYGNNEGVFIKRRSIKKFGWMMIKGYIGFCETL